eukprot:CFRG0792T1
MPQILLEYSRNILTQIDLVSLFRQLHPVIARSANTKVENCKSRAAERDIFLVGNDEKCAFVHLSIGLLPGRSDELKKTISMSALEVLKDVYESAMTKQGISLTVEVRDMAGYSSSTRKL